MFVQSRDSHVRLVDLRIRAVTQRYTGHTNTREYIRVSGTLVLVDNLEAFTFLNQTSNSTNAMVPSSA